MFCRHCGKELSDEALMCPDCGTPTHTNARDFKKARKAASSTDEPVSTPNGKALATTGFSCACVAFVIGVICLTMIIVFYDNASYVPYQTGMTWREWYAAKLALRALMGPCYFVACATIFPALAAFMINVYSIVSGLKRKALSCIGLALSSIVIAFAIVDLAIMLC